MTPDEDVSPDLVVAGRVFRHNGRGEYECATAGGCARVGRSPEFSETWAWYYEVGGFAAQLRYSYVRGRKGTLAEAASEAALWLGCHTG